MSGLRLRAPLLVDLATALPPRQVGAKALQLRYLLRHGYATPRAWAIPHRAHQRQRAHDATLRPALRRALAPVVRPGQRYAVRSSADVEDQHEHAYAGQFRSLLDVYGDDQASALDAVLAAIEAVWASADAPAVQAYAARQGLPTAPVRMAVILQEMAAPLLSGVSFGCNPLTGLDEVVIEAVQGRGERLMQEGLTPERWVFKWGAWLEQPAAPAMSPALAEAVARTTQRIARAYGRPVDLEWVYDGERLWWVQLREITGLANLDVYSNHISGEFLPGLIKPLVWSVNIPLVNGAWLRLLTALLGPNDLTVERLARAFYYRAYFNMGPFGDIFARLGMPREGLELLMGNAQGGDELPALRPGPRALLALPRLLAFGLARLRYPREVARDLAATSTVVALSPDERPRLSEPALLARYDALYPHAQRLAYHSILVALLERALARLLGAALLRCGVDLNQLDLTAGLPEVAALSPAARLDRLHAIYHALPAPVRDSVAAARYAQLPAIDGAAPLVAALAAFIGDLGHLSDSGNDFSAVPWREDPDLVLQMVLAHQPRAVAAVPWSALPLSRWQRWRLYGRYRLTRRFRSLREQVSSRYTYAYGLFRELFLALGCRLAARGALHAPEDVFCLALDELRALVAQPELSLADQAVARRCQMDALRHLTPPAIIYGDEPPPLVEAPGRRLHGVPTSRGRHTGPVRQARGLADLTRIGPGDVLVVPYSDVSWAPLLARAGAVVAASGGMLSHSSIVAREYGLPAVVSAPGVLALPEGALVTVDGYTGVIVLLDQGEER